MTLLEIIPHLIAGDNVRRNAWKLPNPATRYLFRLVSASDAETVTVLYEAGNVVRYNPTNQDFWADDWEVLT